MEGKDVKYKQQLFSSGGGEGGGGGASTNLQTALDMSNTGSCIIDYHQKASAAAGSCSFIEQMSMKSEGESKKQAKHERIVRSYLKKSEDKLWGKKKTDKTMEFFEYLDRVSSHN